MEPTLSSHEANRQCWNNTASEWRALRDRDTGWKQCPTTPELGFAGGALDTIVWACENLRGKSVCVIGSGDNYAAFALAGLGAQVTSTDISEKQLDVARERAAALKLQIQFVRADAANLDELDDSSFDLVCSTNGFFVWISNPGDVMSATYRVLKPGGSYVFYDVHPFQRPWEDVSDSLVMVRSYWDVGPFESTVPSFEYHWTVADLINAAADAGLRVARIKESPADDPRFWSGASYEASSETDLMDWRKNPRAGLPVWLTVCATKLQ